MTKHQKQIIEDLKAGALLRCTEGANYKAWLEYPDGSIRKIRRDSSEKICFVYENKLVFSEPNGIRWRK